MLGQNVQRTLSSYFLPKHNMQGQGWITAGKPCEPEPTQKQSGHFQTLQALVWRLHLKAY